MLINAVCKKCSLTKKAIEYYIEQELIFPAIQENGYRDFSDEDVRRLKKISVLRNLGLSVTDIRGVLSAKNDAETLHDIYCRRALTMSVLQEKQELLEELAAGHDWEQVQGRLEQLQKKQTILERLMQVFSGYYGKFVCLHFAPYLREPILTDKQQEAFDTIVSFLDNVAYDIPDDLKKYLDEISINCDESFVENLSADMHAAIYETEQYMADHKKIMESYIAYKQSEEYKASPACRMEKAMRRFNSASGYNDVFIPAMCRLSESYRTYQEGLQKANEKLIREYPELEYL